MKIVTQPKLSVSPALPAQSITQDVLLEKYAKGDEQTADDIRLRVAQALAENESVEQRSNFARSFFDTQKSGFIPAGRIMSGAGTSLKVCLANCFVQPVGDYIRGKHDDAPSIFDANTQAGITQSLGGGVGYCWSAVRPKGAKVKGTQSIASGPISYMHMFDTMSNTVESAGARRGAQMAVLRIDHPDIERFIVEKRNEDSLTKFNLSVFVTDEFLSALNAGRSFDLVHKAEPGDELISLGARQRPDGMWVYKTIDAKELWDLITRSTYDYAEPGVLFGDNANRDNNLWYCETFKAVNPCAEQWLPDYGCCCLGSTDLTKFVTNPFSADASFDFEAYKPIVANAVRMLDNVLDVTPWPLEQQRQEAMSKRRIGYGFTGLGDALLMLNLRYDSEEARSIAAAISEAQRDAAYWASVELAKEKGPFPLFDADKYLQSGFTQHLPSDLRDAIREHGIRNSHLLSIAPTGTISLAFADNASNGIEPAFSWYYERRKRTSDDEYKTYFVVDHAFRMFCLHQHGVDPAHLPRVLKLSLDGHYIHLGPDDDKSRALDAIVEELPEHWVNALQISASDHLKMVAAVQPFIDSSISKTVNVPESYKFSDFQDLYSQAASSGLKGLATYRPSEVRGAVLSVSSDKNNAPKSPELTLNQDDFDRRMTLDQLPEPILESLRWPKRPKLPNGNPSWTYWVKTDNYKFSVFVGYTQNGTNHPFEVWVNGAEQPRGLGAIAKAFSMDMRSNDRSFVKAKLDSLEKTVGDDGCEVELPPTGNKVRVSSLASLFAKLVKHCIGELEGHPIVFRNIVSPTDQGAETGPKDLLGKSMTPMMDALIGPKEPKTDAEGAMAWFVDVRNHQTGDDFVLFIKEILMPDGQRRPYSVWMSGIYPHTLDGLCKVLSYDMRIIDPAWIGEKLRSLFDFAEPRGDFLARVPSSEKSANYPSTVAYVARLIAHRYSMLGILDEDAYPILEAGYMDANYKNVVELRNSRTVTKQGKGRLCPECSTYSLIKKDSCDYCEQCFYIGSCG